MLNKDDFDPDLDVTFTSTCRPTCNCSSEYINITKAGNKTLTYSNNLSIMHINCKSILPKMNEIRLLIEHARRTC